MDRVRERTHLSMEESAMQRLRSVVVKRSSAPEALSPSSAEEDWGAFFALASPESRHHDADKSDSSQQVHHFNALELASNWLRGSLTAAWRSDAMQRAYKRAAKSHSVFLPLLEFCVNANVRHL